MSEEISQKPPEMGLDKPEFSTNLPPKGKREHTELYSIHSESLSASFVSEGYPHGFHRLEQTAEKLTPLIEKLEGILQNKSYDSPEGFINLPGDKEILNKVIEMKEKKVTGKEKYVVVVGIGGSSLGTKAVYDSLLGQDDILEPNRFPKLIIVDAIDPEFSDKLIKKLQEINDPSEVLINAVSRSGTTVETLKNLDLIIAGLEEKLPNIKDRLVTTTTKDSPLWKLMEEKGVSLLSIPKAVSGRYSVMSSVGLFPLAACGIDINEFLKGAEDMTRLCVNKDVMLNFAAMSAATIDFDNVKHGKSIHALFFSSYRYKELGEWCKQLMSESLAKNDGTTLFGRVLKRTVLPIVLTPKDVHSQIQFIVGGSGKISFTSIEDYNQNEERALKNSLTSGLVEGLREKSQGQLTHDLFNSLKLPNAGNFNDNRNIIVPYTTIGLDKSSPRTLGEFMQFKMMETMYLGNLMHVNAFDNPGVDAYKKSFLELVKKTPAQQKEDVMRLIGETIRVINRNI